ncbi:MAG TPA: zinc-dependent alcohol dehydrogenase [Elusimicrobiota bacterium]|jgi:threonine dehydrogenase-like Zn-dependent dehydrogenase|nr:zinc-dependent alcohol dehydrogenase [Elusimicrobiota bacterium]
MKALVFHKPKDVRVEEVPDPRIQHVRDAVLRVTAASICGSDLHIYNGYLPQPAPMILGHEFMGVVEEVGPRVSNLRRGDRVVVPFPIACGVCWFCRRDLQTHCEQSNPKHYGPDGSPTQKGGGLFGYTELYGGYAGGQADYVRVPFADYGPRKVPEGLSDERALFLSDIIPTGWSAVEWCGVSGGDTVAVFGCGPVGLMAQRAAWLHGARRVIAVDILPYRLAFAKRLCGSDTVDASRVDPVEAIRQLTAGRGADACIDAVGMEAQHGWLESAKNILTAQVGSIRALRAAIRAARRGGAVCAIGVYGADADFPLGEVFEKGLRLRAGQALPHACIDQLLELVCDGKMRADDIVTHRLPLSEAPRAYRAFNDKLEQCMKVVLRP